MSSISCLDFCLMLSADSVSTLLGGIIQYFIFTGTFLTNKYEESRLNVINIYKAPELLLSFVFLPLLLYLTQHLYFYAT